MIDVETYGAAVGAAKRYTDEHSGSDDAVKYTEQSLTSEQQAQARENIGAAASTDIPTDAVKYTAQTLTDAQKTQARTNIGAGTSSFSGSYGDLTNAPPLVKGGGYGGNMIGGTGVNTNTTRYANSVAYGNSAVATANYAFAFGDNATAGNYNRSTGKHAVAIGNNVRAEKDYEFAYGKFNQSSNDTAFSFGDGTSNSDRHNLMELKTDGTLLLNGNAVKTEGGDDDKLRLGQICGLDTSHYFKMGFADLISSTITGVTFLSSVASEDSFYLSYLFGDFLAYKTTTTGNAMVYVAPIPGRFDDAIKTGAWILVENCYKMFKGSNSSSFTSLDLSMFDTSECKNMRRMFYDCMKLTSLDLSTFDTSNVQDMSYMFSYCTALTTLDISSFDMSNVTNYDGMFGGSGVSASGITTLKCPKINPHTNIKLPRTLYSQDGTAYTNLPVTTGTSIELRQSWT